MLSTLSQTVAGYPFGSIVPYVLDAQAQPIVLLSRLAEHTRNIGADPRVSLIVLAGGADIQANARVTYLGRALAVEHPESVEGRYLRFFPAARDYRSQLDFAFYRIEPVTLRVIAGFAQAHWVSREAYAPPPCELADEEETVIARLNVECADSLRALARVNRAHEFAVELIGLDCDGFDLRLGDTSRRFDFEICAMNLAEARLAIAQMAEAVNGP